MKTKLVEVEYSIVTDDNKNHFLHSFFTIFTGNKKQQVKDKILKSLSGIKKLKIIKIKKQWK